MYYQQPQPQVVNKPTAAYILSLLGGIFGLLTALGFIGWGAWLYMQVSPFADYFSGYYDISFNLFGWGWTMMIGLGIWMLITAVLIIVFAGKLRAHPLEHIKWGALILVFSIIGLGGLLGLLGGILALVYKPQIVGVPYGYGQPQYPPQPQSAYSPPITRICPQCGRVVQENVKFCPNCGKQIN